MPSERVQRRIDTLLDRVESAVDDEDWDRALTSIRAVLSVDPDNADALSYQTMAEAALGGPSEAQSPPPPSTPTPEPSDTPSSFADGRYEVTGFLGEGGKKKVYLCHDITLDRDVAFGLIKADGLDEASRQRITREAQAMARLGDNPNIMPIFDLGEENGQPYMVGPLMGGGDVESLIEDAEDGRLSLEDALRITSEICRGLEFAHSKSIIHRDLKPGNVWLTGDGTARIGDFGLAISLDRSRLTQEKMMVGTVSYMPPEQAIGGEITPRADLYSLGAMLYEMVTGRPPFMGDDEIAIIGQHINTPPVAPSWHHQTLPQTLDSLIMRLLAKDPAERPESAAEVLQALEAIDLAEAAAVHEEEQGSLDSMSSGVFVGRHREMDQLKAAFENTLAGHGQMATLVGEPGIGKTRTAQELGTYATMRGGQVLWGRCYESGGAPPYWPWVQAIRSYVLERDPETVRGEMGSTASVIAEIVPDVKERLPDLQPPAQLDDPESARFRLFDSISTFLKTASGSQPIVLMLEDLHWSDRPSLLLLEFLARELSNCRLLIIGNYRDMELNRRHPLSVTLGELSRDRLFERVLLRGLQKHDVRRFIEVAAGIDPPNALVDAVHTQTEGNPLFVTETVRLLIQEGDITSGSQAGGGTSSWEIRIPEGVREVIGRRLDRLSERCNEVLTTAAVMGRQFRFGVLMNLVEALTENMLLDVLDEALDARIVEEVPSDLGLYQFTHAQMQETLTSELSANRTVRLHARIAEALEEFYGEEAELHAEELAEHYGEAEVITGPAKTVKYSLIAGEKALGAHAFERAQQSFQAALSVHDEVNLTWAQITQGLGKARAATATRDDLQVAVDYVLQAFEWFLDNGHNDTAVELALFRFPHFHGTTGMTEMYARALAVAPGDPLTRAKLLTSHFRFRSMEKGEADDESAAESLVIARESGNVDAILDALLNQRAFEVDAGDADDLAAEAMELAAESNDLSARFVVYDHLASYYLTQGNLEWADRAAELGVEVADLYRSNHAIAWGYSNRARVRASNGRWSEALVDVETALNASQNEPRALLARLHVATATGDVPLVEEIYATAIEGNVQFAMIFAGYSPHVSRTLGIEIDVDPLMDPTVVEQEWLQASDSRSFHAKWMLCMLASSRGDREEATERFATLSGGPFPFGRFGLHFGRAGGLIAQELGQTDLAARLFSDSLLFTRTAGYRPELAWTCSDYAELLISLDDPEHTEKITELQDEAIAIATDLGMKPLLERVLAQREILKA